MRWAVAWLTIFSTFAFALPSTDQDTSTSQRQSSTVLYADQDPSKLKYEIAGIVGAYVLWLIGTILLIVLVGNRLRKRSQDTSMTMMRTFHTVEQVVEVPLAFDSPSLKSMRSPTGPKSPGKMSSMKQWGWKGHKQSTSTYSTSTMNSTQSHELHKAKDMDDLTKLYAAVMAHDEQQVHEQPTRARSHTSPGPIPSPMPPMTPRYPPEFAHLQNARPEGSVVLYDNPGKALHHPMAPTPIDDSFPEEASSHYNPSIPSRTSSRTVGTTPLSFVSENSSRSGSTISAKSRPARISVRGQSISQPIGSADLRSAHLYDETLPLSPRIYSPGPPPPTPGKKKQVQVSVQPIAERDYPQQHQRYYQEQQYQQQQQHHNHQQAYQSSHQEDQDQQYEQYPIYYSPPPQAKAAIPQTPTLAQTMSSRRIPPSLALRSAALNNAVANFPPAAATFHPFNTSKPLPFRDMYGDASMRSAPPTKTTFVDRPYQYSGPKTGIVPSTPYSPYTPMTPMTPITPRRLMTKQELKEKRKEEKLKTLNEDDLVAADDDVWGK